MLWSCPPAATPPPKKSSDLGDSHKWPWSGLGCLDSWTPRAQRRPCNVRSSKGWLKNDSFCLLYKIQFQLNRADSSRGLSAIGELLVYFCCKSTHQILCSLNLHHKHIKLYILSFIRNSQEKLTRSSASTERPHDA